MSPQGQRSRLLVMIYHRVLAEPDPMRPNEVDARAFQWQMRLMAGQFNVLPLSEACRRLEGGTLPTRAACVTFDDGYADNLDVALPILKCYALPATFFIATGFLDGGRMWNDTVIELIRSSKKLEWNLSALGLGVRRIATETERYQTAMELIYHLRYLNFDERNARIQDLVSEAEGGLPKNLMLTTGGVRALADAGMEIGAHTVNHPILARLDDERAEKEVRQSRGVLEDITGQPVRLFAFPNGKPGQDYDQRHVAMVRAAGFDAAVSTRWGVAAKSGDLFQLPRFTPWHISPERFHLALVRSYFW